MKKTNLKDIEKRANSLLDDLDYFNFRILGKYSVKIKRNPVEEEDPSIILIIVNDSTSEYIKVPDNIKNKLTLTIEEIDYLFTKCKVEKYNDLLNAFI